MTGEPDPSRRPQELLEKAGPRAHEPPGPQPNTGGAVNRRFLIFDGIELHRGDRRVTVRVRLRCGLATLTGEATDMDSPAGILRATGKAALVAAESSAPGVRLGLVAITCLDLFGEQHVAARVEAADVSLPRRIWTLAGIACVEHTPEEAACLAVLGAVDRWLSRPRRDRR